MLLLHLDLRKASTEGQDIIATISDKAFLEPILDTDDFKKAAKVVGEKSLEMLPLKDLTKVTIVFEK